MFFFRFGIWTIIGFNYCNIWTNIDNVYPIFLFELTRISTGSILLLFIRYEKDIFPFSSEYSFLYGWNIVQLQYN